MRNVPLALGLLLFAALMSPSIGSAERFVVATYNIENAFDVFDDPYTDDQNTDVKPRAEWEAIAAVIRDSDADAVFFQELENEALLVALVAEMLPDAGYAHVACLPTNSERGIHLGVISRVPIRSIASHRWDRFTHPNHPDRDWRWSRDLQEVELLVAGRIMTVFNVHLKSNRDGPDDPRSMIRRTAEALQLKRAATEQLVADPGAWVLALGDFNSDYASVEAADGSRSGPWPATAALLRPDPAFGGERPLLDVMQGLPRELRVTHPGGGRYPPATLDHILASPALAARVVPDARRVLAPPPGQYGSDHRLVAATFDLGD